MQSELRILHLEDDPNDAALIQSTLKAEGYACTTTRVETQEDFEEALELGNIDLILSDYSLPAFDGLSAAEIAHETCPDVPLIFVSGTLGEERAIDSLKSGATDYVLKERLARLVPAVRRALQEVAERADRKQLEVRFIEAQKMDVIGQLAGGVAHDFNNVLAVIMGYGDLITSDLPADSPLRKYTEEIRLASVRASGLTRQLLVFSRKQTVQPVALDLNKAVNEMNQMLLRLIDENIELTIVPEKQIGCVRADSGYVGQVLMNLVVNGRDAMPNGGKLTVAITNVTVDEYHPHKCQGVIPGDYVVLSVNDTGSGMTDEVKAHLFEAFFTTKPLGKGTGLGMATCQTIVQQSGGHIAFDSEIGQGTTFHIYFPRVAESMDVVPIVTQDGPLQRGTETVLLVEDDQSVRHLARRVLEVQGYEVLTASNGADGLRVARGQKELPIHLVVTDVIMPRMDGKMMSEWLQSTYPDLKILFTSGYTDDAIARHGIDGPGIAFLPKPYTPAGLVRKVREMLDS
jgi:signal transduction histidine kinase